MRGAIPIVLVAVSIAGGGAAAHFLKGGDAAPSHDDAKATVVHDAHGEKTAEGALGYFKFTRPFIVPVVIEDEVGALAMLALSVEMDEKAAYDAAIKEPRIRDGFMRVLMNLSHEGYFAGDITDPQQFGEVRARLKVEAEAMLGDTVKDVLIVDYARQAR